MYFDFFFSNVKDFVAEGQKLRSFLATYSLCLFNYIVVYVIGTHIL